MQESEIIRGCKKGKRKAQHALYEVYGPSLMAVCIRYTKTREDAEEVFHDTLMKVFEKIHTFRFKSSLKTWIHSIGSRTAIDFLRKKRNIFFVQYNAEMHDDSDNEDGDEDMVEITAQQALDSIQVLSPNKQLIINLHIFENKTHKEIAEILNTSHTAVRTTYSRARKEIIALMRERDRNEAAR